MLPSFVAIDMTDVYGDSHQHSNGTCAQIGWLSDTGYNTMDGQGNILSRTVPLKSILTLNTTGWGWFDLASFKTVY